MGASAFGAKLQVAGTPNVDIAELTSISGPSISRGSIDVSSHDSTNNLKEFVPAGLADGGEVSVEGNFTNHATQSALVTAFKATATVNYIVDYVSPAVTWAFAGLVTALEVQAPHDGKLAFSATFKVCGKPTLA
jgi:predicted secreted protein